MIKFTNEVKDWDKDFVIDFLKSTHFESDYSGNKELKLSADAVTNDLKNISNHYIGLKLCDLINDKESYNNRNNFYGYNMAIDLFDGLYGYYPTENDIEELDRLKEKVDTYIENKSKYEYDNKEDNNNQLSNDALNAIANHVEELVMGKVEKFVEDKLDKIVDVLGSKLENILNNLRTNQELQTE